jgi:hypothetical protein
MGIIDTLDRDTVEGKVRHYHDVVLRYEAKYSASYDELEKKSTKPDLTPEMEDDLLDWKEALLMLSVYERVLGEMKKPG